MPSQPWSRRRFLAASSRAVAGLPLLGAGTSRPGARPGGAALSFEVSPLADLYFLLLDDAGRPTELPTDRPAELAGPAARVHGAVHELPEPARTAVLGGAVAEQRTTARLVAAARLAGTGPSPAGAVLLEVAEALAEAEPAYLGGLAGERMGWVEEALAGRIRGVLVPRKAECLAYLQSGLGLPDVATEVPVFLVAGAPAPGAFTSRSRAYGALCVVAVLPHPGSSLLEAVLHEAAHAFEAVSGPVPGSVSERLRRGLERAGVGDGDPRMRDVPHTLLFVHSGETVRRLLDPAHVHHGDSHGYYRRVPEIADAVRRHWLEHLDERVSADEAIARVVEETARA